MEKKIEEQINKMIEKIASATDASQSREYALVVESLVMSYVRLKGI